MLSIPHSSSIELLSRVAVGAMLVLAGFSKVLTFDWFVESLASYRLVRDKLVRPAAFFVVSAELVVGGFLVSGEFMPSMAHVAAGILACFTFAIAVNIARGGFYVECGCLGIWKKTKIGWLLLVRNSGLFGLALISAWSSSQVETVLPATLFVVSLSMSIAPLFDRG